MARKTDAQMLKQMVACLKWLKGKPARDRQMISYQLYRVHPLLAGLLAEIRRFRRKKKPTNADRQAAGYTMEKIAYLAFRSLIGVGGLKNYASAGPQHDLFVFGNNEEWKFVCEYIRIGSLRRGVLVEVKGTEGKVSDAQFARLCAVTHFNFRRSVALGVFFTLSGATGFPEQGTPPQRSLRDARLRQVLFNASAKTPIVVFDWSDVQALAKPGALPQLLEQKIRDIEELTGRPTARIKSKEVVLPPHLKGL